MFFEDLSQYQYDGFSWRSLLWRELNAGWLDSAYQFAQGNVSDGFLDRLFEFCQHPVRLMRGIHICQFCSPKPEGAAKIYRNGTTAWVGSGEIRVRGRGRICYAAPTLIYHYIETHHYLPPEEFIEAVLANIRKRDE